MCSIKPHAHIPGDIVYGLHYRYRLLNGRTERKEENKGSGFDRIYSFLRDCIPVGV
jgi:hypothetical protein